MNDKKEVRDVNNEVNTKSSKKSTTQTTAKRNKDLNINNNDADNQDNSDSSENSNSIINKNNININTKMKDKDDLNEEGNNDPSNKSNKLNELLEMDINTINNKKNTNNNADSVINYKIIIITVIVIIIIFIIECFFREPLFKASLKIQGTTEEETSALYTRNNNTNNTIADPKTNKTSTKIMKLITQLGTQKFYLGYHFFIYLTHTYQQSLSFLILTLIPIFITNILKIIYQNSRPMWIKEYNIEILSCSSGYGNPSGHAFSSTCIYLGFFFFFFRYNYKHINEKLKYAFLVLIIALIALIEYTRFYLNVHSINQLLFGSLLGTSFSVLIIFGVRIDLISERNLCLFVTNIKNFLISCVIQIIVFCIIIIVYFNIDDDVVGGEETGRPITLWYSSYEEAKARCPDKDDLYVTKNDGMYQTLSFFGISGCFFATWILFYMIKKSGNYGDLSEIDVEAKEIKDINSKVSANKDDDIRNEKVIIEAVIIDKSDNDNDKDNDNYENINNIDNLVIDKDNNINRLNDRNIMNIHYRNENDNDKRGKSSLSKDGANLKKEINNNKYSNIKQSLNRENIDNKISINNNNNNNNRSSNSGNSSNSSNSLDNSNNKDETTQINILSFTFKKKIVVENFNQFNSFWKSCLLGLAVIFAYLISYSPYFFSSVITDSNVTTEIIFSVAFPFFIANFIMYSIIPFICLYLKDKVEDNNEDSEDRRDKANLNIV